MSGTWAKTLLATTRSARPWMSATLRPVSSPRNITSVGTPLATRRLGDVGGRLDAERPDAAGDGVLQEVAVVARDLDDERVRPEAEPLDRQVDVVACVTDPRVGVRREVGVVAEDVLGRDVGRQLHQQAGRADAHVQRVERLALVELGPRGRSSRTAATSPGRRRCGPARLSTDGNAVLSRSSPLVVLVTGSASPSPPARRRSPGIASRSPELGRDRHGPSYGGRRPVGLLRAARGGPRPGRAPRDGPAAPPAAGAPSMPTSASTSRQRCAQSWRCRKVDAALVRALSSRDRVAVELLDHVEDVGRGGRDRARRRRATGRRRSTPRCPARCPA